jgi:hypothetical protein
MEKIKHKHIDTDILFSLDQTLGYVAHEIFSCAEKLHNKDQAARLQVLGEFIESYDMRISREDIEDMLTTCYPPKKRVELSVVED